ncbi:DUF1877 domain-containing protein [Streptomyces sp. NBC_00989]|uniref:DUF1877 domain-containing protein n=1 Tax=Streptomyces sp. NBC_00989 TaxID=2903705 RepID=UPI00386C367F|nr:DUF1877 domain-containing protein [Streptomyces sp. NBC_00989]
MALTQQFARVTNEYLDRCRASALDSSDASPGWDPPDGDLLDTGWALWGLIHLCRSTGADPQVIALLDRAVSGDPDGDVGGMRDSWTTTRCTTVSAIRPGLLAPVAIADIAAALDRVRLGDLLADLPASTEVAAAVCEFGAGFDGAVREHLTEHFVAVREFYRAAARHAQCVVTWVD